MGWSYTFVTNQKDIQIWSSTSEVRDLADGQYQVTVSPPSWGGAIPAGGSKVLSFNALSVGLPSSGVLTDEMFFVEGVDQAPISEPEPVTESETVPDSEAPAPSTEGTGPARVFEVDVYSSGVTDFRPGVDSLDFGGQSVHNLILGKRARVTSR